MSDTSIAEIMGILYFYLTGIMSFLSMVGSVIIIIFYIWFPWIRTSGRKMLVWLSVADFFTALGNLLGITWYINKDSLTDRGCEVFCKAHAALTIFSSISSFFWTVAIGVHLFVCIVITNLQMANKISIPCHIICWILPGIIAAVTLGLNVLGYDKNLTVPSWCWIDPEVDRALFWQYFSGKLWEMLAYLTVCILYAIIKYKLTMQSKKRKGMSSNNSKDVLGSASKKLTFVPVVFIAVRIWGTLRFIMGNHFGYDAVWIVPLQGVGDSAQGFANCVLFCTMTDKLRNIIKHKLCPCCRNTNVEPFQTSTCGQSESPQTLNKSQDTRLHTQARVQELI